MSDLSTAGGILTIDLDAVAANWRVLHDLAPGAACGAVVKANAYGIGAAPVGRKLYLAGCRSFFVATVDEAIALRSALPNAPDVAAIHVLDGLPAGAEELFDRHALTPILNTVAETEAWSRHATVSGGRDAVLQLDTGMNRLGLSADDVRGLAGRKDAMAGVNLRLVMSHLACADDPDAPMNAAQRDAFLDLAARFPSARRSLANSPGIFLGPDYHFDLVRPGAALYGIAVCNAAKAVVKQVIRLQGRILQVRHVDSEMTVGYGAAHRAQGARRIATVAVGYADGYSRSLSNRGHGYVGDVRVPVVGRVSMDLTTFDVTDVPENSISRGSFIDIVSDRVTPDDVARDAGTIGYEILTALGPRFHRVYKGEA